MAILELEDFSGGVTDYYLNAPQNKLKSCDNLLLDFYPGMGKPSTRPGSRLFSANSPQVPNAQRINTCFYYKDILYIQSGQKLFYYQKTSDTWVEVFSPGSLPAFSGATTSVFFNYSHWNYHTILSGSDYMYPKKLIQGENGVPFVVEAGLPKYDKKDVVISNVGEATTPKYNFIYKFVYRYEYKTFGGASFVDMGATSDPVYINGTDSVSISGLIPRPLGAFSSSGLYLDIYRTKHNETIFYKLATVTSPTTSIDITSTRETNNEGVVYEELYTTGGIVDNDRPPRCTTIHVKGDVGYYGNIIDRIGDKIPYRVLQSVPDDIDSVPEDFSVDLDDDVVAVSSTKNNVVVLCKRMSYRLDGQYDELGRGGIVADKISDTAGCISPQSVVQALDGVFWLGSEGVYFTDGFRVVRINTDFDRSYRHFVQSSGGNDDTKTFRTQGKYDRKKNRVWWAMSRDGDSELNFCYVLDLNWGISDKSTFTTVSGDSFYPSAIEFIDGDMVRCDKRGYVLFHNDLLHSDLKIDTSVVPSQWRDEVIKYNFETAAFNFGTSATRKHVMLLNVTCGGSTNLSMEITSNNDDGRVISTLNPIRFRGNINWGDDIFWGDTTLFWNKQGMVHDKRRFPAKSLRCNFKSVKLGNAKIAIINGNTIGLAKVDADTKTVTLENSAVYDWPLKSVGYFIAFENDGYVAEYEIKERSNDTLLYSDLNNATVSASKTNWVIRGYPVGEVLSLLNLSFVYALSGPTLDGFRTSETGEVE